jgi:hypothetical protein
MSYPILIYELNKKELTVLDVAQAIQATQRTAQKKIYGDSQFKLSEAKLIARKLFPNDSISHLFCWTEND